MNLTVPPFLQPGDTIGIVSTARKVSPDEIIPSVRIIESLGFRVTYTQQLFAQEHQFAGDDLLRANTFQQMLDDPEIKAILCVRGGYGTARIIDRIDFTRFMKSPKWIAGFSDVTVLLCHLARIGICSLHGTMPLLFTQEGAETSIDSLFRALTGQTNSFRVTTHPLNQSGKAQGKLIGGNLSILNNIIGTASEPDWNGATLFLEDVDEYLYHIDRMMGHLFRAGILKKLSGVVAGHFTGMKDNATPFGETAYEIISRYTSSYDYPVCFGFPAGHDTENLTLIFGRSLILNINKELTDISYLETGSSQSTGFTF